MKFKRLEDMSIVKVHSNAVHIETGDPVVSSPMFMIFDQKYPVDDMGLIWNEASKYYEHLFTSKVVPDYRPVSIKSVDVLGIQKYLWVQDPVPAAHEGCLTAITCKAMYELEHVRAERCGGGSGDQHFTVPGSFLTVNDTIKNLFMMRKTLDEYYGAQEPAVKIVGINNVYISGRGMVIA